MASIDDLTGTMKQPDDAFDTELGRQIAEDIVCNREGRLSERQKSSLRKRVRAAQENKLPDEAIRESATPALAIGAIIGLVSFLVMGMLLVPLLLNLTLSAMFASMGIPATAHMLRRISNVDPELGIADPGQQSNWWRTLAPGITRIEGRIVFEEQDRIKVGGVRHIIEPQIAEWLKRYGHTYGAVYSLVDLKPFRVLSFEPLPPPSELPPVVEQPRQMETIPWMPEDDLALGKALRTQVVIEPFEITPEVNTIETFRKNVEGMLSVEQETLLSSAETVYTRKPNSSEIRQLHLQGRASAPTLRDDIQYIEGSSRFGYRYDGWRKLPTITIGGQHFRVTQELWDEMKAIGGRMGIHYLKPMSIPILLSIQPLPLRDLPTEEDLRRVVGIGSDGEFVYADEISASSDEKPKRTINRD